MSEGDKTRRVLFVCLGNICRSPTAHGVMQYLVEAEGLQDTIEVDSAGTGAWHVGESPDHRATAAARDRGYDLSSQQARQVSLDDYARFDHILAMDAKNLSHLEALRPDGYAGEVALLLDYHPNRPFRDVPDPYYGSESGFDQVLDLVEEACAGLLRAIRTG